MSAPAFDVSGLNVCRYDYRPGWKLVSHKHATFFQVFHIIDGSGVAWIDQEPHPITSGAVLFIAPGVAHGLRPEGRKPLRTLDAKFEVISKELLRLSQLIPALQFPDVPEVFELLESVRQEAEFRSPLFREICQTKLKELLLRLARIQIVSRCPDAPQARIVPMPRMSHPLAQKLVDFLQTRYRQPLTSRDMARALSYSYRHICEASQLAYGMTPMRLLMHCRIEAAQRQILDQSATLKEVAESCGFANVHHFSRVFSEIAGTPPGNWREREQGVVYKRLAIEPGFRDRDRTIR